MFWYEIVSLIISILSLIASGLISFAVFYMGKKVENKRYRADIEYQARKFIIDHGDNDILYLPYCIIASGVNRHHKHLRQIYNDFDALPNDVQKEVLKQAGYDYQLIGSSNWIDEGIKEIESFAEKYDFGDTFLYDGAKYFHRAFTKHSSALTSKYYELENLFDDKLGWNNPETKKIVQTDKLSFSLYLESYYRAFVLEDKSFTKNETTKPLDYLKEIKDFPNCEEEELCFWVMVSVREMASYVERTRHGGYMNEIEITDAIHRGDAEPETFEDMYYETLMALYELELDRKIILNRRGG